jgi:hypothetical protein
MSIRFLILLAASALAAQSAPAQDGSRDREQDAALRGIQEGRFIPLRAIEAPLLAHMTRHGFRYLGPELDTRLGRYRLKFMRGPQVVWIDVDARNGHVIGRSGF